MFHEENWITVPVNQALRGISFSSDLTKKNDAKFTSYCFTTSFGSSPCSTNFVASPSPKVEPEAPAKIPKTQTHRELEVETYVDKLKAGFTRFPNSILMQMINGDLNKTEIKVLLLIARLTISFKDSETGKETQFASISKKTIAAYTGVNSKTILEALASLKTKGLIRKIQGSFSEKNQFGLIYEDGLFDRKQPNTLHEGNPKVAPDTKIDAAPIAPSAATQIAIESPPQKTPPLTPIVGPAGFENEPWGGNRTQGLGQKSTYPQGGKSDQGEGRKSTHYKQYELNNILNDNLNHHSQEHPEMGLIQDYFQNLQSEGKREREWEKFKTLSQTYSVENIALGLKYLTQVGVPETGDHCHFPMAYLSAAMEPVLGFATEHAEKKHKETERLKKETLKKQQDEIEEREAQQELEANTIAFKKAFPNASSQREYLEKVSAKFPLCDINGPFILKIAINHWAHEVRTQGAA